MFRLAKSAAYSGGGWEHDEAAPEKREVESNSSWELDLEQEWGRKEFRYLERKETESEMDGDWAGRVNRERKRFPPISILSSALNVIRETWNMSFWPENR